MEAPIVSNREVVEQAGEGPLTGAALRSLRDAPVGGISRRTLLRRSLGLGIGLVAAEWAAGSASFLWSAAGGAQSRVRVGTLAGIAARAAGLPFRDGFPVYIQEARAFVVVVDPEVGAFMPGADPRGEGFLNVRALSQVCPHLGCRPNPCIEDFWFHCPCHQSRYDRLGIKAAGKSFGPAPRGMDRLAVEVDADGVLVIDRMQVTLGPLPVALGQPGLIPPRVANGCL
jgi:nitrite reductase/ring-hydroxylating ferredoxin subunit